MNRFRAGCATLLALAVTSACGKDPARPEVVAPDANADAAFAGDHSDDNGDGVSGRREIAIRDDCDPRDQAAWAPTGGCLQRRGDVTFAEFNAENTSPLAASIVGHMAWRMDPTYLKVRTGKTIEIRNEGGRPHTFTEVANFGGGKVPPLNQGLIVAPECPASTNIPAGGNTQVSGLSVGNHRFQCCIHPWMRTIVKVKAHGDHDED
jgi:plastocyanin